MKLTEEEKRLEKALAENYRRREGPGIGPEWELKVMTSIRSLPEKAEGKNWLEIPGRLFWELCPVACAILIFLAVSVFRYNVTPEQDFAQFFTDDTVETMIVDGTNG
ncbi:MAG: hypothetical protein ACYDHW_13085 [Syntrophorhabdaceae bacterium]